MILNINLEFHPTSLMCLGCRIYESRNTLNPVYMAECRGEYVTASDVQTLKTRIARAKNYESSPSNL